MNVRSVCACSLTCKAIGVYPNGRARVALAERMRAVATVALAIVAALVTHSAQSVHLHVPVGAYETVHDTCVRPLVDRRGADVQAVESLVQRGDTIEEDVGRGGPIPRWTTLRSQFNVVQLFAELGPLQAPWFTQINKQLLSSAVVNTAEMVAKRLSIVQSVRFDQVGTGPIDGRDEISTQLTNRTRDSAANNVRPNASEMEQNVREDGLQRHHGQGQH